MMSSVFWEMWNENHGEIDEKVWVNQKKKKNQRWNFRVCDLYLIEAEKHNAKRDEGSVWIELIFVEIENTVAK